MTTTTGNMPAENQPRISQVKGILFDLDGVLIDSEPLHEFTLLELSDRFGRRFGHDELLQFKGLPELSVARTIQKSFPDLPLAIDEIMRLRLELLRSNFHRVEMIEGALAFVQRAKTADFRLGLTTCRPLDATPCLRNLCANLLLRCSDYRRRYRKGKT